MSWTFTDDVGAFLETAGPSLAARPAENTLLLTVTATLRDGGPHAYGAGDPVLGWWRGADGAAEVLLFADLANPTSNALYLRIGYEAFSDRLLITAEPE
ncbi:GNAT family N-acetyltransferase [[Kitasatospora] papulosa]|uniref:GNAT family N-acetyltransferase n=1 Tax=[Kitasatospora] papulosa TaxID=1464011 RepID=UPI0036F0232C